MRFKTIIHYRYLLFVANTDLNPERDNVFDVRRQLIEEQFHPKNKNRRKAIFNWAAKGLFFLRGGGGYTHSGYYKTLSLTTV